jgi:hypothetical protein
LQRSDAHALSAKEVETAFDRAFRLQQRKDGSYQLRLVRSKAVLQAMFLTRRQATAAVGIALAGVVGLGAAAFAHRLPAPPWPTDAWADAAPPAARVADADASKAELKKLEGTWVPVSSASDGRTAAAEDIKNIRYGFASAGTYKYLVVRPQ